MHRFLLLMVLGLVGSGQGQMKEESPLWKTLGSGDVVAVQAAIEAGGDVNEIFGLRGAPLHEAVRVGRLDLAKVLLEAGAEMEKRDLNGWTPAMVAASQGHLELLKYLHGLGAALDVAENQGITALMWAVANNNVEVVDFLISEGVDVQAVDREGRSALDMVNDYDRAVKKQLVKRLTVAGVKKGDARDLVERYRKAGKTPATLSQAERLRLVRKLIREQKYEDADQILASAPLSFYEEHDASMLAEVALKLPFEEPFLERKIALMRRNLALVPDNEMSRLQLAGFLYRNGDVDASKKMLRHLSENASENIARVAKKTLGAIEIDEKGGKDALPFFDADGKPLDMSVFKGKVVLLDFWASWCKPCIYAIPGLKEMKKKYGDDLVLIGMSADGDENAWRQMIAKKKMDWPHFIDPGGRQAARVFGVSSYPTYIVINHEGKAVFTSSGYSTERERQIDDQVARAIRKAKRAEKNNGN